MDPSLLKDRKAFLKKVQSQPAIAGRVSGEKRPAKDSDTGKKVRPPKRNKSSNSLANEDKPPVPTSATFDYKTANSATSATHFSILARIVEHMKTRYLRGDTWGLTLDEILEEIRIFDLTRQVRHWLINEAIPHNPKLEKDKEAESKYVYKPKYPHLKGKNGLLQLLKKCDLKGTGGLLFSDLKDSMREPEKALQELGDKVFMMNLSRRKDEKAIFFNDKESYPDVDDIFRQMWRGVNIEHLDEQKIEKYLEEQGIRSVKDNRPGSKSLVGANIPKRKQKGRRKNQVFHNEHMQGVLQNFDMD